MSFYIIRFASKKKFLTCTCITCFPLIYIVWKTYEMKRNEVCLYKSQGLRLMTRMHAWKYNLGTHGGLLIKKTQSNHIICSNTSFSVKVARYSFQKFYCSSLWHIQTTHFYDLFQRYWGFYIFWCLYFWIVLVLVTDRPLLWRHTCTKFTPKWPIASDSWKRSTVTPNFFSCIILLGRKTNN